LIRVLNIISDSNIGGAGRVLLNYLRCADRSRFETLAAVPRGSLLKAPLEELGGIVYEVDGLAERSLHPADVHTISLLLRQLRPDVVHTHGALSARIAAKRCGVPAIVMTKHCPAHRGGMLSRSAHRAVDTCLTDAVVAVSEAVGRQLREAGTPERLIHVISNGIVPSETSDTAGDALRERLGLDAGRLWVGVAARMEPVKGVDLFLDAALQLAKRRGDLCFAVFGTGSEAERLREQAEPLGDAVRFCGFVDEIEQALALLDVVVVPSREEAFCLTAAEALSTGTPVAAFDVDGVGEVVRNEETGLLAPAGDTAALARAVERLVDDAELRRRLGENGKRLVRERFTAEAMARTLEALYEQTLAAKGRTV